MSTETKTDRVLRDVLNSDNLRDFLSENVFDNAMRWRFLQAALIVLDGHGLLGDPADAVKDAAPAPLDPALVKAGDTVTLEAEGGRKVTAPVSAQELPYTTKGTWFLDVYYDEDKPQSFSGIHWTLTDHQPAPEPELARADGTFGDALVDGVSVRGFIANGGESFVFPLPDGGYHEVGHGAYSDFVPDKSRPMPTREQRADVVDLLIAFSNDRADEWDTADKILVLLRGESR